MDTPNYAGLIASLVIGVATIGGLGYFVVHNEDDENSRDNSQHDVNSNENENEEEISQDEDTRVFQTPKRHRKSVKNGNRSRRKSHSRRFTSTF